ncbi:MAG: DUF192 domain-containing protein [Gaiellales bacterium]
MEQLIDDGTGEIVVARLEVAPAIGLRAARGLIGRRQLDWGAGLLLADPLRCIHTVGMRFAIDIVFLDRDLRVVGVATAVGPRRLRFHPHGRRQLEVPAGFAGAAGLATGRRLRRRAVSDADAGGRDPAGSPHAGAISGEPNHSARNRHCAGRDDVPSVPLPAVRHGGETSNEGSTPCARIF